MRVLWLLGLLLMGANADSVPPLIVADFVAAPDAAEDWFPLTDNVRPGGRSTADLIARDRYASFEGVLTLNDNSAGFASMRIDGAWDFSKHNRFMAEVRGDDREYTVLIKDEAAMEADKSYSYELKFKASEDAWNVVNLPLEKARAFRRGEELPDAPPLNTSAIRQIGIQINDKIEADYRLDIQSFWLEL